MWYALQTVSGKEEELLPDIRKVLVPVGDCEVFLPKYVRAIRYAGEWHMQKERLFPGYIFVSTERPDRVVKQLQILTANVKPVCIGGGFHPIRPEEQAFLESMMNAEHEIGFSCGNIIDGKLIIDYGPLMEKTESVVKIDRHHRIADVAVGLWGEQRRMRVGLEVVRKQ